MTLTTHGACDGLTANHRTRRMPERTPPAPDLGYPQSITPRGLAYLHHTREYGRPDRISFDAGYDAGYAAAAIQGAEPMSTPEIVAVIETCLLRERVIELAEKVDQLERELAAANERAESRD